MNSKKLFSLSFVVFLLLTAVWVFPVAAEENNDIDKSSEIRSTRGNTLFVGSGQTYSKIQDAVDNANTGDTIYVLSGTYTENVAIDKTLTLTGNSSTNTIINGNGSGSVIKIKADRCNVSGFTITNSGSGLWSDAGIIIDLGEYCNIRDINLTSNKHGIMLIMSNHTSITNCIGYNNTWNFINLTDSDDNFIANCTGYNSDIGFGLFKANNNLFEYNQIILGNREGIFLHFSSNNRFMYNTISNFKEEGVWIEGFEGNHNLFCYNNFISNNEGETQARDYAINKWNLTNPKKGNHWSDWISPDNNYDGIVDTPYYVDAYYRAYDAYPLVNSTRPIQNQTPPHPQPPRINTTDVLIAYVNQFYNVKYHAIDPDTSQANLTWSLKTTANWLTFDSNQTLSGTPKNSDIGTYNVLIIVSDGALSDATIFNLTVFNRTQPPSNGTVENIRTKVRYKTISKAVSEAKSGDMIKAYAKNYKEDVIINKSLTLVGEEGNTILQANSTIALYIRSVNTTVKGFTIKNSNTGILLDGSIWSFYSFDINIFKCTFIDNTIGLKTMFERGFSIYDCTFKENKIGIELKNSYIGQISNCDFDQNTGYAIDILGGNSSSDKITIWNNSFNSNNGATSKYNSSNVQARDNSFKFYHNYWNSTWDFGNFWSDWLSPDNNKDGIVDIPYNISGSAGARDFKPQINFIPNRTFPPQIITKNKLFAYVNKQYISNYSAIDPDTPQNQLTWSMKTNASWLKAVGYLALLGTPNSSDVGIYWVSVSVTDGVNIDSTNFTLTVSDSARPTITTRDVTLAYVGVKYSVFYSAVDQDTPLNKLTWSMSTNASWLTFSIKQELFGTPANTDVGSYWINIAVTDGNYSDSTNFTLHVIARNQKPKNYPGVNSTYPRARSNNISVNNTEVVIEFKTSMNTASVTRALSVSPGLNFTLKWEENNTILKIIFSVKLMYNTTYKITIGSGAFDTENNNLNSSFELEFTTELSRSNGFEDPNPVVVDSWGTLYLAAVLMVVILIIIAFLLVLAFVTKNRRKQKEVRYLDQSRYETEENGITFSDGNGTTELLSSLKDEALSPRKPSAFGPTENKMLKKLEVKYQRGDISQETYEMIKQSMLENTNDQKP